MTIILQSNFIKKVELFNLRIAVNESGITGPDKTKRQNQKKSFQGDQVDSIFFRWVSLEIIMWLMVCLETDLRFNTKFYGYYFYFAIFRCFDEHLKIMKEKLLAQ